MPARVYSGYFKGVVRYVDSVDAGAGKSHRASDADAAGPRTYVEHAPHSTRVDPWGELPLDELGDRRPRDEHARIHGERKSGKPGLAREIDRWHPFLDAARDEIASAPLGAHPDTFRIDRSAGVVRKTERVEHERRGFVERVVGPVTEENPRAAQPAGAALDECAYRNGLLARRTGMLAYRIRLLAHRTGMLASYDPAGPVG
jgi:hypothetical protein